MRVGVASIFLRELPLLEAFGWFAKAGYACVEVWADHMRAQGENAAALRARAAELGLALTVHAPHYDLNPLSSNPGIRNMSQSQIFAALELADALEAETVVLHPGRRSSAWVSSQEAFGRLCDFTVRLGDRAAELGVWACVELMERKEGEFFQTPEDAAELLALDISHLGVTADIAHLHTLAAPDGAAGLLRRFDPAGLRHVHLSDSGPAATHLPLGQGEIDIPGVLARLPRSYKGRVVVEGYVPGRGKEVIVQNMAFIKELLKNNPALADRL